MTARIIITLFALFVLASCSDDKSINPTPPPSAAAKMGADVSFADRNLELLVRWALKKPEGRITSDELAALNHLDARNRLNAEQQPIRNLAGIQHCTGLDTLLLWGHQITDISPLAGLSELRRLDLAGNQVSDASPLAELTELRHLSLWGNQVTDLRPLAGLTKLEKLSLWGNGITDVKPLASLTKLKQLQLGNNEIEDVRPLNGLDQLDWLGLVGNPLSSSALRQQIPTLMKNVSITLKTPGPSFPVTAKDDEPEPAEPPVDPSVRPYNLYVGDPWVLQYEDPPEGLSVRSLPSWLSFDAATGRIEGTPTQAGTYEFVVGRGDVYTERYLLIVADEEPDRFVATYILGQHYGIGLYKPEDGVSFTIEGNLPPGFSFYPERVQIDGTPEATGTFDFDYVVTDASGVEVFRAEHRYVVITDPSPEPTITTTTQVERAFVEKEWNIRFGPTVTIHFYPAWLTLVEGENRLRGVPTEAGEYEIYLTDSAAPGTKKFIILEVVPPLVELYTAYAGQYWWGFRHNPENIESVSTIPDWVSFDITTGRAQGTPTQTGRYEFTLYFTDGEAHQIVITVREGQVEEDRVILTMMLGEPRGHSFPTDDLQGQEPFTFAIQGQIPLGLYFLEDEVALDGSPQQVGTFDFDYVVRDATGQEIYRQKWRYVVEEGMDL